MLHSYRIRLIAVTAVAAALGSLAPAYAQEQGRAYGERQVKPAAQAMPAEQGRSGDRIAYVSGGVGDDSSDRMASLAREYNLKLMFTLTEGNYLADVSVVVTDARGNRLIDDVSNGPFFFAKLPPGQYTVAATFDGKTQTRKVNLGKGMQQAHMSWRGNPPDDFPGPHDGPRTSGKVMESRN
ncbi:MAG TPA: carboxypeptidase-like regulatory domain-containing protein [Burkholderiales bacterium]|nr:carboxypeptidase-like regulatory domain-containing protein [Burkholderiales bacterium]